MAVNYLLVNFVSARDQFFVIQVQFSVYSGFIKKYFLVKIKIINKITTFLFRNL